MKLRIAYIPDHPLPYRVSDVFAGALLAAFNDVVSMHAFLDGLKTPSLGAFPTIPRDGLEMDI